MSQTAVQDTGSKRAPAPATVAGTPWFGLMVAMWSVFVTLLAVSPETLDDVWNWLTGLTLVFEIVMWILLLPWALAYLVWGSSWEDWLRVLTVVLLATAHLIVSAPRPKR